MIFVMCPCKSPNLVKTQTNLADNLKSNWVPWNPWNNFLFTILLHLIFLYSTSLFFTFAFSAIPTIRSHKVFLGSVHIIPWKAFFCSQNKNLAIWFRRGSTFLSPVSCHMSLMPTVIDMVLPLANSPTMHSRMLLLIVTLIHQQWAANTQTFLCSEIFHHFGAQIPKSETNILS